MKKLLYYTMFGDIYTHMGLLSIKSVEALNTGIDILVISDKQFENYKTIIVDEEMTAVEIMCLRAHISDFIDIEQYDQIWFADTDIIFKRNPFDLFDNETHIKVCREVWTTLAGQREWFAKLLSEEDFQVLKSENGINGGFYMIPKCQYEFFTEYKAVISYFRNTYPNDISADQQALNYIYHKGKFNISTMPVSIECFPARQEYKNHYLKHFACYPNEEKKLLMNKENGTHI